MFTDDDICNAVRKFRNAIERYALDAPAENPLKGFPNGCCDHASEMLGKFLLDQFDLEPIYVRAERFEGGEPRTHAWIEFNELVIDITGDQFSNPAVQVTRDRSWHDQWTVLSQQGLAFKIEPDWWRTCCETPYSDILLHLE